MSLEEIVSEDPGRRITGLTDLCTLLCIGDEDIIRGFDYKTILPALITTLVLSSPATQDAGEALYDDESVILTTRALALALEVVPQATNVVVENGGVTPLLLLLSTFPSLELAEESLKCLDRISISKPNVILPYIQSLLACFEQLSDRLRGIALSIIGNVCSKMTAEEFGNFEAVLLPLTNLLGMRIEDVQERILSCFAHLVSRFRDNKELSRKVVSFGLIPSLVAQLKTFVIANDATSHSHVEHSQEQTQTSAMSNNTSAILRLISILCESNSDNVNSFIEAGLLVVLKSILENHQLCHTLLLDALFTIDSMIPLLSTDQRAKETVVQPIFEWTWQDDFNNFCKYDVQTMLRLEAAHRRGDTDVEIAATRNRYRIDFAEMAQYNVSTNIGRAISRKPIQTGYERKTRYQYMARNEEASQATNTIATVYKRSTSLRASNSDQQRTDSQSDSVPIASSSSASTSTPTPIPAATTDESTTDVPQTKHIGLFSSIRRLFGKGSNSKSKRSSAHPTVPQTQPTSITEEPVLTPTPTPTPPSVATSTALLVTDTSVMFTQSEVNTDVVHAIGSELLGTLQQVCLSTAHPEIRQDCIDLIVRIILYSFVTRPNESQPEEAKSVPRYSLPTEEVRIRNQLVLTEIPPNHFLSKPQQRSELAQFLIDCFSSTAVHNLNDQPIIANLLFVAKYVLEIPEQRSALEREGFVNCLIAFIEALKSQGGNVNTQDRKSIQLIEAEAKHLAEKQTTVSTLSYDNMSPSLAAFCGRLHEFNERYRKSAAVTHSDDEMTALRVLLHDEELSHRQVANSAFFSLLVAYLSLSRDSSVESNSLHKQSLHHFTAMLMSDSDAMKRLLEISLAAMNSIIATELEAVADVSRRWLASLPAREQNRLAAIAQPFRVNFIPSKNAGTTSVSLNTKLCYIDPFATVQSITSFLKTKIERAQRSQLAKKTLSSEQPDGIDQLSNQQVDTESSCEASSSSNQNNESMPSTSNVDPVTPASDTSDSAAQIENTPLVAEISLLLNGQPLPLHFTLLQAVRRFGSHNAAASTSTDTEQRVCKSYLDMWKQTHTVEYILRDSTSDSADDLSMDTLQPVSDEAMVPLKPHLHSHEVQRVLSPQCSQRRVLQLQSILIVVDVLHDIYERVKETQQSSSSSIEATHFLQTRLTSKLHCELQQEHIALICSAGDLPSWMPYFVVHFPFLFPFETRVQFFRQTTGAAHSILSAIEAAENPNNSSHSPLFRSTLRSKMNVKRKRKVKRSIDRAKILRSTVKALERSSAEHATLEIEYKGEVGTGLGPTAEFYTLAAHELQRRSLKLWHSEDDEDTESVFVNAPLGLFPKLMSKQAEDKAKHIQYFRTLGRLIGQALQDQRIIDLPLSDAMYKVLLERPLTSDDIGNYSAQVLNTIQTLKTLAAQSMTNETLRQQIDDMSLCFTYADIELKENGAEIAVSIDNLSDYIDSIQRLITCDGIREQCTALVRGVGDVVDTKMLSMFSISELRSLLCGNEALWGKQQLMECIACDHGYSLSSDVVLQLIDILSEFSTEDQKRFVLFTTGCTRLPIGGLRSLKPKLTIVKRSVDLDGSLPDDYLPTCNTCFHYLKLPQYSSKDVLRQRLLYAIHHGQSSFDLS